MPKPVHFVCSPPPMVPRRFPSLRDHVAPYPQLGQALRIIKFDPFQYRVAGFDSRFHPCFITIQWLYIVNTSHEILNSPPQAPFYPQKYRFRLDRDHFCHGAACYDRSGHVEPEHH